MSNLEFENGRVSYTVNGVENALSFNPADASFVERLLDFFEKYNKRHIKMSDELRDLEDKRKIFDMFNEMDKDIRAEIDAIFGEHTCDRIFTGTSPCAIASGLPVWMNFSLSVMEEIQAACDKQRTVKNPKLEAFIKKYRA